MDLYESLVLIQPSAAWLVLGSQSFPKLEGPANLFHHPLHQGMHGPGVFVFGFTTVKILTPEAADTGTSFRGFFVCFKITSAEEIPKGEQMFCWK